MHPAARHVLLQAIADATAPEQSPDEAADSEASTYADRIHALHELNYTFPDLYGLLPREIELAAEGARRANERQNQDAPNPESRPVESAEGTTMRGGPADGADRIGFVDDAGEPIEIE